MSLEHAEGASLRFLLAYSKERFGRGVDYGKLSAMGGTRRVWPAA